MLILSHAWTLHAHSLTCMNTACSFSHTHEHCMLILSHVWTLHAHSLTRMNTACSFSHTHEHCMLIRSHAWTLHAHSQMMKNTKKWPHFNFLVHVEHPWACPSPLIFLHYLKTVQNSFSITEITDLFKGLMLPCNSFHVFAYHSMKWDLNWPHGSFDPSVSKFHCSL